MADNGLDPKRITPEQLATLAALMNAGRPITDPETALSEALELTCRTLEILRNDLVYSAKTSKHWDRRQILEQLIQYMESTGKGATEIGRELGCNRATVTLWRSGKGQPSKKTSAKIARFLTENNTSPETRPE
jgi:DNA-binding XRE family transcriptional regulator